MATITGNQLRVAIQRWENRRDVAARQFKDTLFKFAEEKKDSPQQVAEKYEAADTAVAELQQLQQEINAKIFVTVGRPDERGRQMSLGLAVKLVGGAGRMDKLWREAAISTGRDRYDRQQMSRSKDEELATKTISTEDGLTRADAAAFWAGSLRTAIANGNAQEITVTEARLIALLEQ